MGTPICYSTGMIHLTVGTTFGVPHYVSAPFSVATANTKYHIKSKIEKLRVYLGQFECMPLFVEPRLPPCLLQLVVHPLQRLPGVLP